MKILIIDGFVDEPTCLGVPPFISTYIRYTAGALILAGIKDIEYITITELRDTPERLSNYNFAVIIAGNPVPGKYLGGIPISKIEIENFAKKFKKTLFIVGGPVQFEDVNFSDEIKNIILVKKDIESFIYDYFTTSKINFRYRTIEELNKFATSGAFIVEKHFRHPDVIVEIETSRGCPRLSHCSFCVEGFYNVEFRKPQDIIKEIKALSNYGIKHFRIGKQADLISYGANLNNYREGFPEPNPLWIKILYEGIRESVANLETLHLDNINPGTIAKYPDESAKILETIVTYNTPGDVAALGMESADPLVIEKNFLKATPDEVYFAVKLINQIGNVKKNGTYALLPGINLIKGLIGENRETFKKNYEFLKKIKEDNLLLRRINIRQIKFSKGTYIKEVGRKSKEEKILYAIFKNYREKIRKEIDNFMLKQIFPVGTVLKNLIIEEHRGDWSLGRQIGTYPIIVNIPKKLPKLSKVSAFIVDHRERSITGLVYPFCLSKASLHELKQIPGFEKRATEFFLKKEKTLEDLNFLKIFDKIKSNLTLD